ncbi:TIGR00304 family membrane protein [Methanolobus chelungpuianus]|uniref:TIGR00304 family protein n=1 Tax=Methanolobus chelungpuianus TaxID=502115 RepID=A0AAE3HBK6_9EURY|nr:DUF131 domain-containing protein [Methanolobus chelungpuianus]MCQ6962803.1 hypothetical protein [Methanolobus chelungpuianus]
MSFFENLLKTGFFLVFLGFLLLFLGTLLSAGQGNGDFGGLILIGPIPIAFGSSPGITSTMMWAGLVIALVYLVVLRRFR